jgi:hypothetical protein
MMNHRRREPQHPLLYGLQNLEIVRFDRGVHLTVLIREGEEVGRAGYSDVAWQLAAW